MRFLDEDLFAGVDPHNLVVLFEEVLPDFQVVGRLVAVDADHDDVHLKNRLVMRTINHHPTKLCLKLSSS